MYFQCSKNTVVALFSVWKKSAQESAEVKLWRHRLGQEHSNQTGTVLCRFLCANTTTSLKLTTHIRRATTPWLLYSCISPSHCWKGRWSDLSSPPTACASCSVHLLVLRVEPESCLGWKLIHLKDKEWGRGQWGREKGESVFRQIKQQSDTGIRETAFFCTAFCQIKATSSHI